ncbi:hypothetical protein [Amycolatopsis balhimycina]|uniref:hypothetical protein n=1 Tax=Amycolatopsis balhimycina TaxID=208443 RepID=UPI00267848CA|nr:hypothetical protein [Amycolatopsis balhimycina]
MTRAAAISGSDAATVVKAVTVIMGVVGLTFLFGFGNVLNLALRLGVPIWVAPLVAPAVDLSILGLLLGTRHLALTGASAEVLAPARRLLIFASVVTLALNVADPLFAGEYGKAAFDAVGPLLLIGWAEVGPSFLQAISAANPPETAIIHRGIGVKQQSVQTEELVVSDSGRFEAVSKGSALSELSRRAFLDRPLEVLLEQARQEDAAHRVAHQRPISADTLRVRMRIGATPARRLVKIIRAEFDGTGAPDLVDERLRVRCRTPMQPWWHDVGPIGRGCGSAPSVAASHTASGRPGRRVVLLRSRH